MLAELAKRHAKVYPVFIRHGLVWEEAELPPPPPVPSCSSSSFILTRLHAPSLHACSRSSSLPVRDIYGAHWSTTGRKVPHARTPDDAVYLPGPQPAAALQSRCLLRASTTSASSPSARSATIRSPTRTPKFFRDFAAAAGAGAWLPAESHRTVSRLTKEQVIRRGLDIFRFT